MDDITKAAENPPAFGVFPIEEGQRAERDRVENKLNGIGFGLQDRLDAGTPVANTGFDLRSLSSDRI